MTELNDNAESLVVDLEAEATESPTEPEPSDYSVHAKDGRELRRFPCVLDAFDAMKSIDEAESVVRTRDRALLGTKDRRSLAAFERSTSRDVKCHRTPGDAS